MSSVLIKEGMLLSTKANEAIEYGAVSSCLTLTATFRDGHRVGIHCVLIPSDDQTDAKTLLENFQAVISKNKEEIVLLDIAGVLDWWDLSMFGLNGKTKSTADLTNGIAEQLGIIKSAGMRVTNFQETENLKISSTGKIDY